MPGMPRRFEPCIEPSATELSPTRERQPGIVSLAEIEDGSALVGRRFAVDGKALARDAAALSGSFSMIRLRPGLVVHTCDATELHHLTTSVEQQPGLTIHFFLEGVADAYLGEVPLNLGRPPGRAVEGVLTARAEPDLFVRHTHEGNHVRGVNITMSREWLADSAFASAEEYRVVRDFAATHRGRFSWRPSPSVVAVAGQMLHPPHASHLTRSLYLESRALDLASDAFAALTLQTEGDRLIRLKPPDRRRLRLIDDFLAEHANEVSSLEDLARIGGVSVSTLRRLFQAAYGMGVFEHLRCLRLERARLALERGEVAIAEAAFLAGYASPANFATAFKRRFGLTPSDVRRH